MAPRRSGRGRSQQHWSIKTPTNAQEEDQHHISSSSVKSNFTEGPTQPFSPTGPKVNRTWKIVRGNWEPGNRMDLGSVGSQDWLKSPGMRCKGPIGNQEPWQEMEKCEIKKQLSNGVDNFLVDWKKMLRLHFSKKYNEYVCQHFASLTS